MFQKAYGWLSKLGSLLGSNLGYPKRCHNFDNYPYEGCIGFIVDLGVASLGVGVEFVVWSLGPSGPSGDKAQDQKPLLPKPRALMTKSFRLQRQAGFPKKRFRV